MRSGIGIVSSGLRRRMLGAAAVWIACAGGARAQPDLTRAAGSSVADAPSTSHRFESFEFASADGQRHYRVQLAIPLGKAPVEGFPLLCMLDGNAAFAALRAGQLAALQDQGTPLAIAAIGYATSLRFDVVARAFDYTPPVAGQEVRDELSGGRRGGGADLFLDLLEAQIRPVLRACMLVDSNREALWGHSYGGLCVLHALLRRPSMFRTYIVADPSLWWQDGYLLREEADATPLPTAMGERQLLVMTGIDDQKLNVPAPPSVSSEAVASRRAMRRALQPDATRHFVERQATRSGLQAALRVFDNTSHGALLAASIPLALDLAAGAADIRNLDTVR